MTIRKTIFPYIISLGLAVVFGTDGAQATTGSGCYQVVNVAANDVLNVRAKPSAASAIVYKISPQRVPIISGGKSTADAEAKCTPRHRPLASRWCPIAIFDGSGSDIRGWAKRRFLSPSECP